MHSERQLPSVIDIISNSSEEIGKENKDASTEKKNMNSSAKRGAVEESTDVAERKDEESRAEKKLKVASNQLFSVSGGNNGGKQSLISSFFGGGGNTQPKKDNSNVRMFSSSADRVKLPNGWEWNASQTLLFRFWNDWRSNLPFGVSDEKSEEEGKEKKKTIVRIAGFDFDGTLAKTSLYKKGPHAWSFLYNPNDMISQIESAMKEMEAKPFSEESEATEADAAKISVHFVIFSNQSEIGRFGNNKRPAKKAAKPVSGGDQGAENVKEKYILEKTGRVEGLIKRLFGAKLVDKSENTGLLFGKYPVTVMFATGKDDFRKPGKGMWNFLKSQCFDSNTHQIDLKNSFFVGDAAGRAGDHSCSD
eukprot:Nk52_evm1s1635 gene=Nk52_evmTU1s1635